MKIKLSGKLSMQKPKTGNMKNMEEANDDKGEQRAEEAKEKSKQKWKRVNRF